MAACNIPLTGLATTDEAGNDRPASRVGMLKGLAVAGALAAIAVFTAVAPASAQTIVTIQQVSSNRYVDAHEHAGEDYRLVTRAAQNNSTQLWRMTQVDGQIYTFQQLSSGRFMDAHEFAGEDYRLVTRPAQNNDTQRWLLVPLGGNIYTIQQVSNGRYVDAHEIAAEDYRLVTRPAQNNATQQWRIATVLVEEEPPPPTPVTFSTGSFELPPAFTVNLDNGILGAGGADLAYQTPNLIDLQLAPINGAEISFAGGAQRGFSGCSAAAYSTAAVPLAALSVGNYVCVRTDTGRISEFRINAIGPVLRVLSIGYTTWQ